MLRLPYWTVEIGTAPERDFVTGPGRLVSLAVLVVFVAAVVGGATMWLLLTDPVTVANAVDAGEVSPLVRRLAQIIVDAFAALLQYL